jgi:Ca-activated chloride channel family protein
VNQRPLAAGILGILSAVTTAQVPVFRSGVELVRIEVSVTRGGRPVSGLGLDDFEVRDNDLIQTLNSVLLEQVPLDVYFVLDMSQSVRGPKLAALRQAAGAFLDGLKTQDRAALVCFSQQVALNEPLTGDLARVKQTLQTIEGTGSTAMRDALYAAIRLHEDGSRRAAAVVFSDGIDNLSWLHEDEVVEAARRSDVVVYSVLAQPPTARNQFLNRVTEATGGRLWRTHADKDLTRTFEEVLRHIRSRYLLTYYPQGVERAGWHTLKVRLKHGRGDVLARPGYFKSSTSSR